MVTVGRNPTIWILFSAGIHALLLVLNLNRKEEIVSSYAPVIVEAYESAKLGGHGGLGNTRKRGRPAWDLSIGVMAGGKKMAVGIFQVPIEDEGSSEAGSQGLGRGFSSGEGRLRNVGIVDDLYQKIDHAIIYPDELRENGSQGIVQARLKFSPEGLYLRSASTFSSPSRYLSVYVSRTLRRLFVVERGPITPKGVALDCTFEFLIDKRIEWVMVERTDRKFRNDSEVISKRSEGPHKRFAEGNRLYFYREHNPWRSVSIVTKREKTGMMRTTIGGDVLPLIGSAISAVTGLFSRDPKEDPLNIYERDPDW